MKSNLTATGFDDKNRSITKDFSFFPPRTCQEIKMFPRPTYERILQTKLIIAHVSHAFFSVSFFPFFFSLVVPPLARSTWWDKQHLFDLKGLIESVAEVSRTVQFRLTNRCITVWSPNIRFTYRARDEERFGSSREKKNTYIVYLFFQSILVRFRKYLGTAAFVSKIGRVYFNIIRFKLQFLVVFVIITIGFCWCDIVFDLEEAFLAKKIS